MARKTVKRLDPEAQARLVKRYLGFGCLSLLLLAVLILLINYKRATGGPALPAEIQQRVNGTQPGGGGTSQPTGPAVNSAIPPGTPPLTQQLARIEYAGCVGDQRPQTLYVSDSELNAVLAGSLKGDGQLRQVRAYFGEGKAYMVGLVNWKGHDLNVTVTAAPVIVNGGVRFGVEEVRVGSMGAPAAVTRRIQDEANKNSSQLDPTKTGLYVQSIDVRPGVAILYGHAVARKR